MPTAIRRHQNDTKTFEELTTKEQALAINAHTLWYLNATRAHGRRIGLQRAAQKIAGQLEGMAEQVRNVDQDGRKIAAFDPAFSGYVLKRDFDRRTLDSLLNRFERVVKRDVDRKLTVDLRYELMSANSPGLTRSTFHRLARWCKTAGIYSDGMHVAQRISELLFGKVIDRASLGR